MSGKIDGGTEGVGGASLYPSLYITVSNLCLHVFFSPFMSLSLNLYDSVSTSMCRRLCLYVSVSMSPLYAVSTCLSCRRCLYFSLSLSLSLPLSPSLPPLSLSQRLCLCISVSASLSLFPCQLYLAIYSSTKIIVH